jgi:transposase
MATRIPKVRFGHNKEMRTISLVVTKNKGLPIFFRTYEGNISDVTTIQQLILDIKGVQF